MSKLYVRKYPYNPRSGPTAFPWCVHRFKEYAETGIGQLFATFEDALAYAVNPYCDEVNPYCDEDLIDE